MSRVFCIGLMSGFVTGAAQGLPHDHIMVLMLTGGAGTELVYALVRAMR